MAVTTEERGVKLIMKELKNSGGDSISLSATYDSEKKRAYLRLTDVGEFYGSSYNTTTLKTKVGAEHLTQYQYIVGNKLVRPTWFLSAEGIESLAIKCEASDRDKLVKWLCSIEEREAKKAEKVVAAAS